MTNSPIQNTHRTLTDEKLYGLCRQYGEQSLSARRKFMGLLPEVQKRHLYAKKGFRSVEEFAAKLGGISGDHVRRVLSLERRFADKPDLKMALTSGAVSVNKLAKIASIATGENQAELAGLAKNLPCRALETLARDERIHSELSHEAQTTVPEKENGLPRQLFEAEIVHVNNLQLDKDVHHELQELQKKGIDISALIREMLEKRRAELTEEKQKLAEEVKLRGEKSSRYIPAAIRHHLRREHGNKCTIQTCGKQSTTIHHTQRFALSQNHDLNFMAPLCADHHQIAHSIDQKYQMKRLL